jgi:hypothetical protein
MMPSKRRWHGSPALHAGATAHRHREHPVGQESTTSGTRALGELAVLDQRAVSRQIRDLSRQYNIEVDPDAVVGNLLVGAHQRVEITKALYPDADILILDEPTAVLTPQEADELFVVMHNVIRGGIVGSCSEPRGGGTSLEQSSCEPNPAADRNMVIAGFDTLTSATYEDK